MNAERPTRCSGPDIHDHQQERSEFSSFRSILHATSLLGAASFINLIVGLLKIKVAAVVLGPAGVGLIGLLQNLMQVGANLAGLGLAPSGKQRIAAAQAAADEARVALSRKTLVLGTLFFAALGGAAFWVLRNPIATQVIAMPELAPEVGWLAVGIFTAVASGAQAAFLSGVRRTRDLAKLQIYSATSSLIVGSASVILWGPEGILFLILSAPVAALLWGYWFTGIAPRNGRSNKLTELLNELRGMASLAAAFLLSSLATAGGYLAARILISADFGAVGLGHFQAAWMVGATYLSFVLAALSNDYFSKLCGLDGNTSSMNHAINEQTEVLLLLTAPLIIGMIALSPWVLRLLYSSEFEPAADILRVQLVGDTFRVLNAPLAFLALALRRGRRYMLVETAGVAAFLIFVYFAASPYGLQVTGYAYCAMHLSLLCLYFLSARSMTSFSWSGPVLRLGAVLTCAALATALLSGADESLGVFVGVPVSACLALYGGHRLARRSGVGLLQLIQRLTGRYS